MEYLYVDFLYIFTFTFVIATLEDDETKQLGCREHGHNVSKIEETAKLLNFSDKKFRFHMQEFLMYLEPRQYTAFGDVIQE